MANDAVQTQLPIMVRRPKIVWPGLDRMDLHRKMIAGDGNCLFASLADQLYGSSTQHLEIRAAVIDHMRAYRPLFENVAIKDDIQQKRATRAATNAIRNSTSDDNFEEYLAIMSKPGSYGGEPELVAFVQCFNQDVLIHLPRMLGYPETIPYTNAYRPENEVAKPQLHLCYGGENANAHYDSARPNGQSVSTVQDTNKTTQTVSPPRQSTSVTKSLTSRAIRSSKADISRDIMHELVLKGALDNGFGRARSPSVSSSHNSTGSKRSHEDDGEAHRATKRADRRKLARGQVDPDSVIYPPNSARVKVKLNSGLATPASTQDSEGSSDQSDRNSQTDSFKPRNRRKPVSRSLTPDTSSESARSSRKSSITLKRAVSSETMISSTSAENHSAVHA